MEIQKYSNEEKIDIAISDIEKAVENKDKKEIKNIIDEMIQNIKNLITDANKHKIGYIVINFLNKIVVSTPTVRKDACEVLYEKINEALDGIKFEKQTLIELKKYLINCKRNKEYNCLTVAFIVLVGLHGMQSERIDQMDVYYNVWKCGINGIKYIPKSELCVPENSYREFVEEGMNYLRKK